MVRVRLTKKLAAVVNGMDISALHIGDIIELPDRAAQMLMDEGWAVLSPDDLVAQFAPQHLTRGSSHAN